MVDKIKSGFSHISERVAMHRRCKCGKVQMHRFRWGCLFEMASLCKGPVRAPPVEAGLVVYSGGLNIDPGSRKCKYLIFFLTVRNFWNHILKKHIDIFHDKYHLLQNVWHPGLLVRIKIKLGVPYYTLYAKVIFDYKKFHIHTILKFKHFHLKINLAQSD